jgi:hypothetical protein
VNVSPSRAAPVAIDQAADPGIREVTMVLACYFGYGIRHSHLNELGPT